MYEVEDTTEGLSPYDFPFDDPRSEIDWEQVEAWELRLTECERQISSLRAEQAELVRLLDPYQPDLSDGARTMGDWVASRLDLPHRVASRIVALSRARREMREAVREGRWGLDRAALLIKLREAGASEDQFREAAEACSLSALVDLICRLRRVSREEERASFQNRYLLFQPDLEASAGRIWGEGPGQENEIIWRALERRESSFPSLPGQSQGQRRYDALLSICLDSLTAGDGEDPGTGRAVTVAEVFVDATLAGPSAGEAGVLTSQGLRAGPGLLEEILCEGRVRVISTDGLRPLSYSDLTESIPPVVRSWVIFRDGGRCAIEGCRSRYRIQVHHLRERQDGGDHEPHNLVCLCWCVSAGGTDASRRPGRGYRDGARRSGPVPPARYVGNVGDLPDFRAIQASSRHGTRARYKAGCRCEECRGANAAY